MELESKLADYDVRHSDLASSASKLAMEQRRIDEKARKALRGPLELHASCWSRPGRLAAYLYWKRASTTPSRRIDAAKTHGIDARLPDGYRFLEDLAMDRASERRRAAETGVGESIE